MAVKVALAPTPGEMRWIELFLVPLFHCRFPPRGISSLRQRLSAMAVCMYLSLLVLASFSFVVLLPAQPTACLLYNIHTYNVAPPPYWLFVSHLCPPSSQTWHIQRGPLLASPIWYSQEQVLLGTALFGSDPLPSPSCRWLWWAARHFITQYFISLIRGTGPLVLLVPGQCATWWCLELG